MTGLEDAVVAVLRNLQPGDVISYGEVATEAGYPGRARAVGNILQKVDDVPWWRVVNASGRLVPGHERKQAQLLRAEGVTVREGKVRAGHRRSQAGGRTNGVPD